VGRRLCWIAHSLIQLNPRHTRTRAQLDVSSVRDNKAASSSDALGSVKFRVDTRSSSSAAPSSSRRKPIDGEDADAGSLGSPEKPMYVIMQDRESLRSRLFRSVWTMALLVLGISAVSTLFEDRSNPARGDSPALLDTIGNSLASCRHGRHWQRVCP
jgi:hypothetical protein